MPLKNLLIDFLEENPGKKATFLPGFPINQKPKEEEKCML